MCLSIEREDEDEKIDNVLYAVGDRIIDKYRNDAYTTIEMTDYAFKSLCQKDLACLIVYLTNILVTNIED